MDKKINLKEQRKLENYERIRNQMTEKGYTEKQAIISVIAANILCFVTAGPLCVLIVLIYLLVNGTNGFEDTRIAALLCLVSIPIHEFLHGLGWVVNCKNGWKSISFGVMWKSLTPYCHCAEVLSLPGYFLGLFMPFVVLGVVPSIAAIVMGNGMMLVFGAIALLMAGGDTTIALILAKFIGKGAKVADHPNQCGCVVYLKE